MRLPSKFRLASLAFAVTAATTLVAACGGGGGGDSLPPAAVSGTAAVGAPLVGAQVALTCANGNTITGVTGADGTYATNAGELRLPCIGQATKSPTSYRGVLFAGTTANFTPLTDILVEVMLAAAAPGDATMSLSDFLGKIRNDATFAANVSSPSSVASYRNAVVEVVREMVLASGGDPALLGAALSANFESAVFAANGADPLDKLLDDLQPVLQDPSGNVIAAVIGQAKTSGNELATPPSTGTGGTGGTGGSGT